MHRYVVAALLAATVGGLIGLGGLLLGAGRAIASGVGWTKEAQTVWSFARWPIGFIVVAFAVFLLFRMATPSAARATAGDPRRVARRRCPVGGVHGGAVAVFLD